MTALTPQNHRRLSSVVSLLLKIIGLVLIVSALVDIITLSIPYQVAERQWQINFAIQVVDRGLVPLVGVALFLMANWINTAALEGSDRPATGRGLGLWVFILASALGLLFVLLFPLHLNNLRVNSSEVVARLEQEATQAEAQLDGRLQAEIGQQRQQLERLLANPGQLDQALESGLIPQDQATLLRQFRQDPDSLNTFIEQRTGQLRQQLQTEIGERRQTALNQSQTETLRSGLRVGLNSALLAIGYIVTGWLGLKTWISGP